MTSEVTILPGGVAKVEAALHDGLNDLLEWVAAEARRAAPVGDPGEDPTSGEFRDSIHVVWDGEEGMVVSDSDHARFVEFGSNDTPAQPTISPAFEAGMSHLPEIVGGRMAERL